MKHKLTDLGMYKKQRSITLLLAFIAIAVVLVSMSALLIYDYINVRRTMTLQLEQSIDMVKKSYIKSVSEGLWTLNEGILKSLLLGLVQNPYIAGASIKSESGALFLSQGMTIPEYPENIGLKSDGDFSVHTFQLTYTKEKNLPENIGTLYIVLQNRVLKEATTKQVLKRLVETGIEIILLAAILVIMVRIHLVRPIIDLTRQIQQADVSKNKKRRPIQTNYMLTELNHLADSFNKLISQTGRYIQELNNNKHKALKAAEDRLQAKSDLEELNERLEELVSKRTHDLEETYEKLAHAKTEAEQANYAKSDFLASMSHEIRTPMNGIIGLTQLCLKTQLTDTQKDYLDKIEFSSKSLLTIINDILDFSKIEAGKLEIENVQFRLEDALTNLIALIGCKASEKKLELALDIAPDIPSELMGDPVRINQILLNLCANAVKFTETGGVIIRILPKSNKADQICLRFEVDDTGIGITPEMTHELFKPFTQASLSTTREFGGTGLGLTICKRLVDLMNGKIGIDSKVGTGSRFWFEIELKKPFLTDHETYFDSLAFKTYPFILIVDESDISRHVIEKTLTAFGARIITAKTYALASDILQKEIPKVDAVLADCPMTKHPEVKLINKLSKGKLCQRPPIAMLTADADQIPESICSLSIPFLMKPYTPKSLFHLLRELFYTHKTEHAIPYSDPNRKDTDSDDDDNEISYLNDDTPPLNGLTILLAEDNSINQQIVTGLLHKTGVMIDFAENGAIAVDMASQRHYDVILMDLYMPVLGGKEATKKIRTIETYKEVPIFATTAESIPDDADAIKADGFTSYIKKPFDGNALIELLLEYHAPAKESVSLRDIQKVLIVDDNEINRFILEALMKMEGIQSIKAKDGKIALELLESEQVDMVLMDLEMPVIDGFEATRRMKRIDKLAHIPVVAVTANALPQKLKECEDIGMAGWVTKPVFKDKLFEVMMKAKNN